MTGNEQKILVWGGSTLAQAYLSLRVVVPLPLSLDPSQLWL